MTVCPQSAVHLKSKYYNMDQNTQFLTPDFTPNKFIKLRAKTETILRVSGVDLIVFCFGSQRLYTPKPCPIVRFRMGEEYPVYSFINGGLVIVQGEGLGQDSGILI